MEWILGLGLAPHDLSQVHAQLVPVRLDQNHLRQTTMAYDVTNDYPPTLPS